MVRTSVFGWRTFPDLWFARDHFVGKVSSMGQPGQFSLLSLRGRYMSSNPYNCMDYGVDTIKRQTRAAYGWLVVGRSVDAGLAYGL